MEKYYREINDLDLRFSKGKTSGFPSHLHNEIELKCILHGEHYAHCNGKTYLMKPGSIFIACPNQIHSFSASEACEGFVLIINPALAGEIGQYLSEHVPVNPLWEGAPDNPILQMLDMCYQEYRANGEQDVLYSMIGCLLQMLCRALDFHSQPAWGDGSIRRILQYCSEHYKENINLQNLANNVFLSPSHISHIFSEKLKISFPDYINALRLAEAKRLLEQNAGAISEIATLAGFATIRSFNRAFRNRHGISPKDYRKQKFVP